MMDISYVNRNKGLVFKKFDSINIALFVMLIFISISGLMMAIYGDDYQVVGFYVILKGIYFLSLLNAMPAILRNGFDKSTAILIIAFSIVYILSALVCSDEFLKDAAFRSLYMWSLPYFFAALKTVDYKQFSSYLRWVGYVTIICELLRTVVLQYITSYSQDVGYHSLIPFIIFCVAYMDKRRFFDAVLFLVSLVLILMSGSRGPLLCAILGLILSFVATSGFSRKSLYTIFSLVAVYIVYSMFQEEILRAAIALFDSIGVSTRSLEGLLYSDIAKDSSREGLRNIAMDYIASHPLWGTGFLNDRLYIYSIVGSGTNNTVWGVYCHNFFLEVMMQFGMIPGFILLFHFFKKIYRRIKESLDKYEVSVMIISITIGLFPLFVSRSWFTFSFFYFLVGLLFAKPSKEIQE